MSSEKSGFSDNNGFVRRFIEVCGSDRPIDVQRVLGISYQAAKNYLSGRYPDTPHLLIIAEKTPYSVHWLLTGQGKKFVIESLNQDTPLSAHQLGELVRKVTVEVINEIEGRREASRSKIVTLHSENVYSEKAVDETATRSESRDEQPGDADENHG